jgi:subtilisin family serine protease
MRPDYSSRYSQDLSDPSEGRNSTTPLELVNLEPLMQRLSGIPEVRVGLIDGPVNLSHPDLESKNIQAVAGKMSGVCSRIDSFACTHGTFVAGALAAHRGSLAPAICPDCTLLVRPIFTETTTIDPLMPTATPLELARAIVETVDAGARVINLSAALLQASAKGEQQLAEALNYAARRGSIVIAAAGNQSAVGSTCLTRHRWVIPVVACDLRGRPLDYTNLGDSISRRGVRAPGHNITSIGAHGKSPAFSGTSAAAPFVTGTIALLWSEFPHATADEVKLALERALTRRTTVVPPLLDAWGAYQAMTTFVERR